MSEDSTHDHTMWSENNDLLDNTMREAILNDVFLHQPLMDSTAEDNNTNPFSAVTTLKKRKIGAVIDNSAEQDTTQSNINKQKLIMVVKGKTENIAEKNQLKLKKFFIGHDPTITANDIKLHKDYITVAVQTEQQRDKFFTIQEILGKEVEISEHNSNKNISLSKVIIFGVATTWTSTDILEETEAMEIYRLNKYNPETSIKEPTTTVILTFNNTNPPKQVFIGFKQFNTKPYIPKPQRCFNCQLFGHSANTCRGKTTCARCAKNHKTEECPLPKYQENSDNVLQPYKCRNCNEHHASGYRGCAAYVRAQTITEIKTVNKISYAEAINKMKETSLKTTINNDSENTLLKTKSTNIQQSQSPNVLSSRLPSASSLNQSRINTNQKMPLPSKFNFLLPTTSTPGRITLTPSRVNKDTCINNQNSPAELSSKESTYVNSFITVLELIIIILKKGVNHSLNLETITKNLLDLIHTHGL